MLAHTDLMVRAVDPDNAAPQRPRLRRSTTARCKRGAGDLACERVYYAAGQGHLHGGRPLRGRLHATIFDAKLQPEHEITLTGLPSRARVSADGRYGAMTVFVSGDSYLESPTAFSTRTTIVDMASGKQLGQLEQFEVTKDGKPFDAVDFNFWGVTFDPRTRTASTRRSAPAATTTWSKATSPSAR